MKITMIWVVGVRIDSDVLSSLSLIDGNGGNVKTCCKKVHFLLACIFIHINHEVIFCPLKFLFILLGLSILAVQHVCQSFSKFHIN